MPADPCSDACRTNCDEAPHGPSLDITKPRERRNGAGWSPSHLIEAVPSLVGSRVRAWLGVVEFDLARPFQYRRRRTARTADHAGRHKLFARIYSMECVSTHTHANARLAQWPKAVNQRRRRLRRKPLCGNGSRDLAFASGV